MIDPSEYRWHKSSRSQGNGECVEMGQNDGPLVGLRDTKDEGHGPVLSFRRSVWTAFVVGAKSGDFDQQ
jgi:hypothetical protein